MGTETTPRNEDSRVEGEGRGSEATPNSAGRGGDKRLVALARSEGCSAPALLLPLLLEGRTRGRLTGQDPAVRRVVEVLGKTAWAGQPVVMGALCSSVSGVLMCRAGAAAGATAGAATVVMPTQVSPACRQAHVSGELVQVLPAA